MSALKVLIVGAGLAGLCLAQSLRKAGIAFEIFEKDESADSRDQGWSLTLTWTLPYLASLQPPGADPIEHLDIFHGTDFPNDIKFYDGSSGHLIMAIPPGLGHRRVSRSALRRWLSHGINIKWGHRLESYKVLEGDRGAELAFSNGSIVQGTIVVGADGVGSAVREIIFAGDSAYNAPQNIPMACLGGYITLPSPEYQEHMKSLAHTFYIANGASSRIFVGVKNLSDDKSSAELFWTVFFNDDEKDEVPASIRTSKLSPGEVLAEAKAAVNTLDRKFTAILDKQDPARMIPTYFLRDRVPTLSPTGPATLIGDASHPMSFFRGEGGNSAIQDAQDLAEAIIDLNVSVADVSRVLRHFESRVIERTAKSVIESRYAALSYGPPPQARQADVGQQRNFE